MQLVELKTVRHRLTVGVPLPFNVRQADSTLLLACGQVIDSPAGLEALFERGMLVDIAELRTSAKQFAEASVEQLPAIWAQLASRVTDTLTSPAGDRLDAALDDVAEPLLALIEREPDLAVFQVLRQHGNLHTQYGLNHSLHCAIAASLAAQRLGWEACGVQRAVKAALTMNISMLELQGQLATQGTPVTPRQREAIYAHPTEGVRQLRLAGICDKEWLQAVAEHHETPDGMGYPLGLKSVPPLATLLQQCDVYTAKLSPRQSREALTADVAARGLFAAHRGNSMTAALIKEFGVYPPGSFVRLASGETGIVVRRGAGAHTPRVAAMTSARGTALRRPEPRDTSRPGHAIVAALSESNAGFNASHENLMEAFCT